MVYYTGDLLGSLSSENKQAAVAVCEVTVQVTVDSAKCKNRACLEAEIKSRSGTPRKQRAVCVCGVFVFDFGLVFGVWWFAKYKM